MLPIGGYYKRVGLFCKTKDYSPLPGQKTPRTRRREERKEKKQKYLATEKYEESQRKEKKEISHRFAQINAYVKGKRQKERCPSLEDDPMDSSQIRLCR